MIRVFRFIYRQKQSGICYFRYKIPSRHRHLFPRTEIKRSLRTADKQLAIVRGMALYSGICHKLNEATFATPKQRDISDDHELTDIERFGDPNTGEELADDSGNTHEYIEVTNQYPDGTVRTHKFDTGNDEKDAALASLNLKPLPASAYPTGGGPMWDSTPDDADLSLQAVAKLYRQEKVWEKDWTEKTHDEHRALHSLISKILPRMSMRAVDYVAARKVKATLLKLPPNANKGQYQKKDHQSNFAHETGERHGNQNG